MMQNSNDPSLAEPYNCRDKDFIWLHNGKRDNLDNIYLHAKTLLEDFYYKLSGASGSKLHCIAMSRRMEISNFDEKRTLKIDNLGPWNNEESIRRCFARFGEVVSVKITNKKQNGDMEAFVEFSTRAIAEQALNYKPSFRLNVRLSWASTCAGPIKKDAEFVFPVYVENLDPNLTDCTLLETFKSRYHSVKKATVLQNPAASSAGYVTFGNMHERHRAITEINEWLPSYEHGQQQKHPSECPQRGAQGSELQDYPSDSTVFVSSTGPKISANSLWQAFSRYGELVCVEVIDVCKRCGYVQFANKEDLQKLPGLLQGTLVVWFQVRSMTSNEKYGYGYRQGHQVGYRQASIWQSQSPRYAYDYGQAYGYVQNSEYPYICAYGACQGWSSSHQNYRRGCQPNYGAQPPQSNIPYANQHIDPSSTRRVRLWSGHNTHASATYSDYGAQPAQYNVMHSNQDMFNTDQEEKGDAIRQSKSEEVCVTRKTKKPRDRVKNRQAKQAKIEENTRRKCKKIMRMLASFGRVPLDTSKEIMLVPSKANLYKNPNSDKTYYILAEVEIKNLNSQMHTEPADQLKAPEISDETSESEELSATQTDLDADESGIEYKDAEPIAKLTGISMPVMVKVNEAADDDCITDITGLKELPTLNNGPQESEEWLSAVDDDETDCDSWSVVDYEDLL